MMPPATIQAVGNARLAEMQHQAQRDALARVARQARRRRRRYRAPGIMTAWARHPRPGADAIT